MAVLLSTALVVGSAESAHADGAEAFVGGLLGGAIGTAISNSAQRQTVQQPQRVIVERKYVKHRKAQALVQVVDSYQRNENRRVQTALNYFGFSAGPADGVMGPASRSAVASYQASVGFAPTGMLMEHEKVLLTSSYERAVVGGPQAAQIMAASGGPRGLLLAYRQEQLGMPVAPMQMAPVPVPPVVMQAAAPPVAAQVAAPAPVIELVQPVPTASPPAVVTRAAAASTLVPSFMPAPSAESLATRCNGVMMGVGGAAADPSRVLDEQFCVARSHAIDQANSLMAAIDDFTPDEMRTQCEAFTPTMVPYAAALAGRDPAEVAREVRAFLHGTGAQTAQMSGTARVCLGIGYATDNAELAVGSALALVALGEMPYAELVGYQLANGYGVPAGCSCGLEWTGAAMEALGEGARPLVADPSSARRDAVTAALMTLGGSLDEPAVVKANANGTGGFALPKSK